MILDDSAYMLRALQPILTEKPMDVRQDFEEQLLHLWRRYRSLPDEFIGDGKIAAAQTQLIDAIIAIRDTLNDDKEYVIFKTLVGFRSVFPHMWEEDGFDFEKNQRIRDKRQGELLDSVSEETWENWKERLGRAAAVQSNDGATFPPLDRFFEQITTRHPTLGLQLLTDRDLLPRWTIPLIANGLLATEACQDAKTALLAWAENGDYLSEIASTARFGKTIDRELVLRVAEISRDKKVDEDACFIFLEVATRRFAEDKVFWRDEVFFPCLKTLHACGNRRWIDHIWSSMPEDSLFADLRS